MFRIWDAVWTASARSTLVAICCLAFSGSGLAAQEDRTGPDWQPMRIKLVRGDLPACEPLCPEWISMEGQITETTPALFSAVLKQLGTRRLPIVVNSFGGSVEGAIKLGRMIRKNGLDVVVGTTRLSGCLTARENCLPPKNADGTYPGFAYDYQAQCNSSCGYMMAGGVLRFAGGWAQVGVHQITTTYFRREPIYRSDYKSIRGKKRVIDRRVMGHKQVTTSTTTKLTASLRGNLTAYFNEMGISPAFLQKALSIPAADMYTLSRDEMKAMRIVTGESAVRDFVSFRVCEALPAPPHCIALADSRTAVAAAPPTMSRPKDGRTAFELQDYQAALQLWQPLAERGDPSGQNGLGLLYVLGRGVAKDVGKGIAWLRKAADQNDPKAQRNLGELYARGENVPRDEQQADFWFQKAVAGFRKAADKGDATAQSVLGDMYLSGEGSEPNVDQAIVWLEKAARNGDGFAQLRLGRIYTYDQYARKDGVKAVAWLNRAAKEDKAEAQHMLGMIYSQGVLVPRDMEKASFWFQKAAAQQKPPVEINASSTSEAAGNSSCDELKVANEKTRNTGRYQDVIHDISPNRYPPKLILSENRFDGSFVYENQRNAGWKKYPRPMIEGQQNGEPVFENCSRLADEVIGTTKAIVIAADWHRGSNRAKSKVWISADTGKFLRTERTFTAVALGYGPQVGAPAVEIFTYDRTIEPPPPFDQ